MTAAVTELILTSIDAQSEKKVMLFLLSHIENMAEPPRQKVTATMATDLTKSVTETQLAFKFVLVGESSVGKTAICKQFCEHTFVDNPPPTLGLEFGTRTIEVDGTRIKLQIWDTAGQERFHSITRSYFRASAAVIFVYDVTKRESFGKLGQWVETGFQLSPPTAIKVLIGNKTDLTAQRTVSTAEAEDFAEQNQLKFFETSALSGDRIDDAFLETAHAVHAKILAGKVELSSPVNGGRQPLTSNIQPSTAERAVAASCC
jgi:small GTP-binding protein